VTMKVAKTATRRIVVGVVLLNGTPQHPKRTVILRAGDVLTFRTPGGGGYGDPRERSPDRLAEDRNSGLVG